MNQRIFHTMSLLVALSFMLIAPVNAQQIDPPQPNPTQVPQSELDLNGSNQTPATSTSASMRVVSARILDYNDNYIHGFVYYGGYLWASTRTYPARILRINPNDLSYERIILSPGLDGGEDIVAAGGYLWVVLLTRPGRIVRIDPTTLQWQVAVTFNTGELSYGGSLVYDFGYLWVGGYDRKIARVNIDDLTYQVYSYPSLGGSRQFHAITSAEGFIWASSPYSAYKINTILKINPNNPNDFSQITVNLPFADDIAFLDGSLYANSEYYPSYLYRIESNLKYISRRVWSEPSYGAFKNPLKPDSIYGAYIGNPGAVLEFDKNMNLLNTYTLPSGFRDANEIAFDGSGNMYVTSWNAPAGIVKFSEKAAITPKEPIIFIPGITGSYLDKIRDNGTKQNTWPLLSDVNDLLLDPSLQPWPTVVASDVIRDVVTLNVIGRSYYLFSIYGPFLRRLISEGYVEYQVKNDPTLRTTSGCDLTQDSSDPDKKPSLFVFAYDWRKDNATNAASLSEYMGCVRKFWPDQKVTIITHSMGGLLARRYIIDHPQDHNVSKLITIAAPWLGAPKAISVLETGDFGIPDLLIRRNDVARVAQFSPGAHQLLPSKDYERLAGTVFFEEGWDVNKSCTSPDDYDRQCNIETYNAYDLQKMLDMRYPFNKQNQSKPDWLKPGSVASQFHEYNNAQGWKQDDWTSDTSGITYYHIYGDQSAARTIGRIRAWAIVACSPKILNLPRVCTPPGATYFKINATDRVRGDDTVPLESASRIGNGLNLNARQNTTVVRCFGPNDDMLKHSQLTSNPHVFDYVLSILKNTTPPSTGCETKFTTGQVSINQTVPTVENPVVSAYYLNLINTSSLSITDAFGNVMAIINDSIAGDVPGVTIDPLGERSIAATFQTDQSYAITFRSGSDPMIIELQRGTNTFLDLAVRYLDMQLPVNTSIQLTLTPLGAVVYYDGNNDSIFETYIPPTFSVSGAKANDVDPPEVIIRKASTGPNSLITIDAVDVESGVRGVFYSIDGINYTPYTKPISVDILKNRVMYAFAEDGVGNRSSIISREFAWVINLPLVLAGR